MNTTSPLLVALLLSGANLAHAAQDDAAGKAMWRDLSVCPKPVWPPAALAHGAEGRATIAVRVDTSGRVLESRVDASSGHPDLDQAARDGIARCRFHSLAATLSAPSGWRPMQYVWQKPAASARVPTELVTSTRAAAEGGDATAQTRLGWWYQQGTAGPVDTEQAESWYRRAADGGNAKGQFLLAHLYFSLKRADDAIPWLRRAADGGDASAKAWLAWAYRTGTGVTADDAEARRWQAAAADTGIAPLQSALGHQLLRDVGEKPGTDADRATAVDWLEKAAAQQDAYGQLYLARSHELGNGAGQDAARAVALYRAALGRTGGRAEVYLGAMLEEGRGVTADPAGAATLYRQAMAVPYGPAFHRYGRLLAQGIGIVRNERQAVETYLQGADLGDCNAMKELGKLYVTRDAERQKGYEWIGRGTFCEVMREGRPDGE